VALAFLGERLEQRAEETFDARLSDEKIDGELHDVRLNLCQRLGAAPLQSLAGQRSAQRVHVARVNRR
jgi:predicted Abi (CAAX) family protease